MCDCLHHLFSLISSLISTRACFSAFRFTFDTTPSIGHFCFQFSFFFFFPLFGSPPIFLLTPCLCMLISHRSKHNWNKVKVTLLPSKNHQTPPYRNSKTGLTDRSRPSRRRLRQKMRSCSRRGGREDAWRRESKLQRRI